MQNQIDTLRQLNYELIKNLGLFRQRAVIECASQCRIDDLHPSADT